MVRKLTKDEMKQLSQDIQDNNSELAAIAAEETMIYDLGNCFVFIFDNFGNGHPELNCNVRCYERDFQLRWKIAEIQPYFPDKIACHFVNLYEENGRLIIRNARHGKYYLNIEDGTIEKVDGGYWE